MKHIHFIGICGVAMSALAIAFKKTGFDVTGSDVGFFPPVSTNLEKHNIKFYPGWHPEKIGTPDLVVVGNVASSTNPEWQYVQTHKLNYKSYPEAVAEFFVKQNSIVCAGTYGKTTTSALLSFILIEAGINPSYMFGGIATKDFPSAQITDSLWSVLEGDEYKSSRWDNGAKFFHYSPTHLLLTGLKWDHADVYPTEELYFEAFEKLIKSIPTNGLLVVSENIPNEIVQLSNCQIITYGQSPTAIYQFNNLAMTKNGLSFTINHNSTIYNLQSKMLGEYNAENITGAFAMAHQIGIEPDKIIAAIAKFGGIKRRLEKRGTVNGSDIYDDIAHSPTKAKSVLQTLRQIYTGELIAVFEPNTGNRYIESIPQYQNAFANANEVIIPHLTKIKTNLEDTNLPLEGEDLAKIIAKSHNNARYIADDKELVEYLKNKTKPDAVIVWLGSHGFRGMIDELVK